MINDDLPNSINAKTLAAILKNLISPSNYDTMNLRYTLTVEVFLLVLLLFIERIHSVNIILSLILIIALIFVQSVTSGSSELAKRRWKVVIVLVNFLMISLFFIDFSYHMAQTRQSPYLSLPYKQIGNIAYFLMYTFAMIFTFAIPIFIFSLLQKKISK